jgi:hypothetical protein
MKHLDAHSEKAAPKDGPGKQMKEYDRRRSPTSGCVIL